MTQRRSILGLRGMTLGAALTLPLIAASTGFGWLGAERLLSELGGSVDAGARAGSAVTLRDGRTDEQAS